MPRAPKPRPKNPETFDPVIIDLYDRGAFACLRCGDRMASPLPNRIEMVVAMMKAWSRMHRGCARLSREEWEESARSRRALALATGAWRPEWDDPRPGTTADVTERQEPSG